MRVAIITDTVSEPDWSEGWKKLCITNSIEFEEFDSYDPDFIDKLLAYNPYRTLWRSGNGPREKFKDEAQRQILDKTNLRIVSNWRTHWVYDHKIRQSYLFKLHNIPHPKTRIFFKESYALEYIKKADYPFVLKADGGAGSKSFRFIEDKEQARERIDQIFHKKGKWTGREYENHVFYAQEYIPAPGIWRISMFKNKLAYGYFNENKVGTITASGRGHMTSAIVPLELFDTAMKINHRMGWDWQMYDIIWSEKHKKYLVLEITDTCSARGRTKWMLTHYKENDTWVPKKEVPIPLEIIFKLFVMEDTQ